PRARDDPGAAGDRAQPDLRADDRGELRPRLALHARRLLRILPRRVHEELLARPRRGAAARRRFRSPDGALPRASALRAVDRRPAAAHLRALARPGRGRAARLGQDRSHARSAARARGRRQPRLHILPALPPLRHRRHRRRARRTAPLPREDQRRPHHPCGLARSGHGSGARLRPRARLAPRLRHRHRARGPGRHPRRPDARRLRRDGRDDRHRVVRRRGRGRHGEPAGRDCRRPRHRAGREPHDALRAKVRRDHGVHRDGARPARPAERTLRRSRTDGMRALTGWIGGHPVLAFLVVFAVFPFLVPYKALATQVLIYGLFALGFNLLYGYTGLLSFGHAAYWGLGAYGTGIALVALAVAGLKRILDSPFGAVLQAIRENSDRAVACGYDATRVKHLSFVFSALFAGLAGALDALRLNVVPIESLYWSTSGQVVIMTLLGGAGTFFGPFVG